MLFKSMLGALLISGALSSQAAVITYQTEALSGNRYTTSYTVTPSAGEAAIDEFTIFFDYGTYSDLTLLSNPAGFDPLLVQPDQTIPADGFFDALALGGGIAFGQVQGGFAVSYLFTGTGLPGAQRFDIVDSATFTTISSGVTVAQDALPPGDVPEPGTLGLLAAGVAGMASGRRRARSRRAVSSIKA
jgi:hypothetical protein